eukprot:692611-Rhodomonas_salina.1
MEMVAPAVEELVGDVPYELRDVLFYVPLYLETGSKFTVRMSFICRQADAVDVDRWDVTIKSRRLGMEGWFSHATMTLVRCDGWNDRIDVSGIKVRCSSALDCGEEWYKTVGNTYLEDFKCLQRIWEGDGERLGEVKVVGGEWGAVGVGDELSVLLRACALMDGATHLGITRLHDDERLDGLYVSGVQSFRFRGTARNVLAMYVHCVFDSRSGVERCLAMDMNGAILCSWNGLKRIALHTVSCDELLTLPEPPIVDTAVDILVPRSVEELHDSVQERLESQAPLCVTVKDEELAAYVMSLRAEHPTWQISCVVCGPNDEPGGAPADTEEGDWRLQGGVWAVRRLKWLDCWVASAQSQDEPSMHFGGVILISGGLGYLGRLVAEKLIDDGASKLVLLSSTRSELPEDWKREMRPAVERCDVGSLVDVQRVVDKYGQIQGIVHAAGVLADGMVGNLAKEDFRKVYGPKVDGARNLH